MQWQRLDRDNSEHVINSVKSDANDGLFTLGTSEVKRAAASFYKDYYIYKVTNYASLPSFSFQYLSDGKYFSYLDGSEDPIYAVNDKGTLSLTETTVIPYLTFYFEHVSDDNDDIILINNLQDMPLLDSLGPAVYDSVFKHHKPTTVTYDESQDYFSIEADLYMDSQLVRADINVNIKGRVTVTPQKMIMHDVMTTDMPETIM